MRTVPRARPARPAWWWRASASWGDRSRGRSIAPVTALVGVDRAPALRRARAAGVIRTGFTDLAAAPAPGPIVLVLAAPPRATVRLLAQAARRGLAGTS